MACSILRLCGFLLVHVSVVAASDSLDIFDFPQNYESLLYHTRQVPEAEWPSNFIMSLYTTADAISSLKTGDMSVLSSLASKGTEWLPEEELVAFIFENNLCDALELLLKRCFKFQPSVENLDAAAEKGHVEMLKITATNCPMARPSAIGIDRAIIAGHVAIMQLIAAKTPNYFNYHQEALDAARRGHLDILKWISEAKGILPSYLGISHAALSGHLEVVEWLFGKNPHILPTLLSIEAAAQNKHYKVVQWYSENRRTLPAIHHFVVNGLFGIADWLHSKSDGNYPNQGTINEAFIKGDVQIISWLSRKRPEIGPDSRSILDAVKRGHEASLIWLLQNSPKCLLVPQVIDALIARGTWFLVDNLLDLNRNWIPSQSNVDRIIKSGRVMTLARLFRLSSLCEPSMKSVNEAALCGHVGSLHLIYERFPGTLPDASTISSLYTNGKRDVIHFIYTVVPKFKTSQLNFNAAALNGHANLLEYCHSKDKNLLPDLTTIAHAKMKGHNRVEEWFFHLFDDKQPMKALPKIRIDSISNQTILLTVKEAKLRIELLATQVLASTTQADAIKTRRKAQEDEGRPVQTNTTTNIRAGAPLRNPSLMEALSLGGRSETANMENQQPQAVNLGVAGLA
ncbi:hypothetical protein PSACC_03376 [Paramicrosporidium saccamoebae]|uniref:Uncharacterized protein n=1 Tax=Paramicrosporidium saccamoebae TaxID=1246581 RepID=A0A2H9TG91_9FUNG|nr:hypothetical protein PSACC_03376 [Paramicrosporidium saccamoebae]